ncbi:MAG: adenylate/guanylate cyclase domain-containing protein [Pseudomonadota bacterium]|nr:MAG: adenylate/guanylate cyclase domain-containing protein [Pseudomonadota bacterium]
MPNKKNNYSRALGLAAGVWLFAVLASTGLGLTSWLDHKLGDFNLRSLAARLPPDPDIVIIDIDEPALEAMALEYGRYPWSRAVFGALLHGLARQGPAAIVFDILFVDPHKDHAADDLLLINAARATPQAYFPMVRLAATPEAERAGFPLAQLPVAEPIGATTDTNARAALLLPLPGLVATGRIGTIDVHPDTDGVVRAYPLFTEMAGWRIPSLPARVAQDLGYPVTSELATLRLVWHGPALSYRRVSFHDVYFDLERRHPERPRDEFANKIVIIGSTAAALFDLRVTPMGAKFPGPEVVATAVDNLKNGERLRAAPPWSEALLTALSLMLLAVLFARGAGALAMGLATVGLTVVWLAGAWVTLVYQRLSLPVVAPIVLGGWIYYLVAAVQAYLLERRNRQRVTRLFARFLDPRVVGELVEGEGTEAALRGQRREITVLFSDIRGFTTLSEQKSPQEVVDLLNRYFSLQVEVIFRHQGTLDKYIGDAIMAFWGAPGEQPDHACRALAAARDMQLALAQFKEELGAAGEQFDIGIGVHTGEAVVGFIGSPEHRQDYTIIGDTVNTASRIESATKGKARILVSQATRDACRDTAEFVDHGFAKLKGRTGEVHLYEPKWT